MAYATLAQLKAYLRIENSDTVASASAVNDTLTMTTQSFVDALRTADPVTIDNDQTPSDPPAPLVEGTVYYVIKSADLTIKLATSSANANAGTAINLTDTGTGSNTLYRAPTIDDDLLSDLLDRATALIETYTNRVFEAVSTTRYYEWDAVDGIWLWLDDDMVTVTGIVNGDSDATAIPVGSVTLYPRNLGPPYYKIRLNIDSDYSWEVDTDDEIEITGTWGYSATPPDDVVQACVRWAAYLYRQKDAQVFDTTALPEEGVLIIPQGIPRDVERMLLPYRRLAPV